MDNPSDNAIGFQLAELLDEHFLRNPHDSPFQIGEAQHLPAEEVKQNHQLPSAFQKLECLLNAPRGCDRRVLPILTFG